MATAATVELGEVHEPKEESIKAFKEVEHELKQKLIHERHEQSKHEPEYFDRAASISDQQLAAFGPSDFVAVRVGKTAYGLHLLGKIRIPDIQDGYIHVRIFVTGPDEPAKLHSIFMEEKDGKFRAIFSKNDPLEWFDA